MTASGGRDLPNTVDVDSVATVHRGRHWETYTTDRRTELDLILRDLQNGTIDRAEAERRLRGSADRMRKSLLSGEAMLNGASVKAQAVRDAKKPGGGGGGGGEPPSAQDFFNDQNKPKP